MEQEIIIRFLLAALWGGIVGAEREYRSKSAGFRTMIMISVGSCFFTLMSIRIGGAGNPDRIASNIVTGIGFLGAGVIFRGENRVNGITTAATIWAVAAIGMGIGGGFYFASAAASILITCVLAVLPYLEKAIDGLHETKDYTIKLHFEPGVQQRYEKMLHTYHLKFKIEEQVKLGDELKITWQVWGKTKDHIRFTEVLCKDTGLIGYSI